MGKTVQVYYGDGRGKTTASLGLGIRAAGIGKQVIMIQFLKKKHSETLDFLQRLEPELKIFRFEKASSSYSDMTPEQIKEQKMNIQVALNYTRKVLDTGQCDLLILDDILGLIDYDIIDEDDLVRLLDSRDDSMDLILTGRRLPDKIREMADCIYYITTQRENGTAILHS